MMRVLPKTGEPRKKARGSRKERLTELAFGTYRTWAAKLGNL